jgi:iron complex outermembrane receptor protein
LATTGDGPFFDQGGVFGFHENLRVDSNDYDGYAPGDPVDISLNQRQATTSFGVFDSATYKITPDLTFGAGVRLSTDHKVYTVACTLACVAPPQATVKTNYTGPTYNVDLTYAVNPDVTVYGRIASGYLAPALDGRNVEYDFGNVGAAKLTEAQAETTTSYEVGIKSNLLDNRARLNLTAYRWNTDDLQLTAVGGQFNSTQLLNAKHAIGQGFEGEGELVPIENLLLTASFSYNFTEIQDPNLEVASCGDGCVMENARDPRTGNYYINGNPLPNAPRWVVDASAKYTIPVADAKDVYLMTDWSYRSDVNFFLYRAVEFTGMSLVQGGFRLGYEDHTHGLEVAGFVRNVLDQIRITGAIDFDNLTGFVNDPRTFGAEVRVKF